MNDLRELLTAIIFVAAMVLLLAAPVISLARLMGLFTAPLYKYLRFTAYPDLNPPGFEQYFQLLNAKLPYFRLLSPNEQRMFVSRVRYIRNHKNFRSRDTDLVISDEMVVLFSASLAQLTFGLSDFDLTDFTELQLTATTFYSRLVEHQVKGLTFESGRIILSWADFEEGYRIGDDRINLGLHELSHALWITFFDAADMQHQFHDWNVAALRELRRIEEGTDCKFFREYASTNIEEFWACCVECFFEAPVEFKSKIPDLYVKVSQVLNQDMAARVLAKLN